MVKLIDVSEAIDIVNEKQEFPGPMPDLVWEQINGNREATDDLLRLVVDVTKAKISERFQEL